MRCALERSRPVPPSEIPEALRFESEARKIEKWSRSKNVSDVMLANEIARFGQACAATTLEWARIEAGFVARSAPEAAPIRDRLAEVITALRSEPPR